MGNYTPALRTIAYICLYTSDLRESVRFYRDILGLEPTSPNADLDTIDFYSFNTGTGRLGLEGNGVKQDRMKTVAENPVLLQFKAESQEHLEAMNQHLEAYGITLYDRSTQTSYGTITNFCDPDGNRLEILYEG
ncbi:MAG TPA: VOC family protein [Chloroflexia bacterium]|jgi:catechol 2,3-dioxygenase-like lactoylglutathione lyase family enzyme|nr:VOC family protein [Chloroflexia bacterium]